MRRGALTCLLVVGVVGGCAGGENSAEDNFTFGGADGPEGDGSMSGASMTSGPGDGTADGTGSGGADSNGPGDDNSSADGVQCIDADGDDYGDGCAAGPDCDDSNVDINPGVGEACNGIDDNCDEEIDNGCECPEDGVSGSCNSPNDLGMIDVGGSIVGVVGTIPQENSIDWYTISFPAASRPGMGIPSISFSINSGEAFAFDVVNNQCDAMAGNCTDGGMGGTAMGLTSWTFEDNEPGCCTPPMDSLEPWPNQVYVRVYRTDMGASCATYQLQASR